MKVQRWKFFEILNFCCLELNNLFIIEIKYINKVQCNLIFDREIDMDKVMNLQFIRFDILVLYFFKQFGNFLFFIVFIKVNINVEIRDFKNCIILQGFNICL